MIKSSNNRHDIQFDNKLQYIWFAEMKRIKVHVDGYTSGAEFIQKTAGKRKRYDLLWMSTVALMELSPCVHSSSLSGT